MPETHLTQSQIIALRDGELRDWAPVRHLQACPECQSRLREARQLGVLLSRPESDRSPHPGPEELAAYAEETILGRDVRALEAHLAACAQCFADLEAIQAQMRPAAITPDSPPDWLVAAASRQFEPPRTPLKLGALIVEWLRGVGLSLELSPPDRGPGILGGVLASPPAPIANSVRSLAMFADADVRMERISAAPPPKPPSKEREAAEIRGRLDELTGLGARLPAQVDELRDILEDSPELLEAIGEQTAGLQERLRVTLRNLRELLAGLHALVSRARELQASKFTGLDSEPVVISVADLRITIRASGRAQTQVRMTVIINRSQDDAPVPGARLVLRTEGNPDVTAISDASGASEFSLPQGQATLVVQSPIRAELQISF